MHIVHRYQTRRFIYALLLALLVVCSTVPSATAQEQTVTLAFYQGLNLEQDEVVSTPEVISVVFCGTATEPFVPALDRELFGFSSEVDLFLPSHPQSEQALWLAAGDGAQVMLLPEIPFEQVTLADLVSGDWQQPDALSVPDGTTIVLRTVAGNLYALRLTPQAGSTDLPLIEVTYRPLFSIGPTPTPGPTVAPEPGSGLLVLLGLALLLGWWNRNWWLKKTGGKSAARTSEEASGTLAILVVGLALLGLMLYQTVIAQDTCVLTVTIETVGRGQVIGTDVVCDEQCSLSYQPGDALNLKAVPAEGSLFVEWRLDGEPVAGIVRLHGDATLTAVFASDGSTPEFSVCDNSYENALDALRAYQAPAVAAPPDGMSLWFKADTIQQEDLVDGWVQRWPDASGQATHATQSDLARQPRYRPHALNGLPVVEFDGQDDRLIWSQSPGNGEFMLFVVARTNATAAEARRYLLGPQSMTSNDHTLIGLYTDRLASYLFHRTCNNWGNCWESVNEQAVYAGSIGSEAVLMAIESQYNEIDLWLNGERVHEVWPATLSPSSWRSLGGSQTSRGALAGYFQGEIAEVLLYPTGLTQCEQFQVEQYLRQKYDLPLHSTPFRVVRDDSATPAGGTLRTDDHTLLYTPAFGVTGRDEFEVIVTDQCHTTNTLSVAVQVQSCDDQHLLVTLAGPGGQIAPAGETVLSSGGTQTVTITPDALYAVEDVVVDGISVGAVDTYTFADIRSDHRVEAQFRALPTGCPLDAIQVGARANETDAWQTRFFATSGSAFQVGGVDEWGQVHAAISLTLAGPQAVGEVANGDRMTLTVEGTYTLTARCGLLERTATVYVGDITWDFETGDLRGWTATGNAFTNQPVQGEAQGFQGDFWINTYSPEYSELTIYGDPGSPAGTLTSIPFPLTHPVLSFLLHGSQSLDSGWGPLLSQTVRLLIDGEVVREVSPTGDGVQRVFWEMPEFLGQIAQIQLEDSNRYIGWGSYLQGFVAVDDVHFQDLDLARIRMQKDSSHAWAQIGALPFGEIVKVGAFYGDESLDDLSPGEYELLIEGPQEFRQRFQHGEYWRPPFPGTYTLYLSYRTCEEMVTLDVVEMPVLPLLTARVDTDSGRVEIVVVGPAQGTEEVLAQVNGDAVPLRGMALDAAVMECYVLVERGGQSGLLTLNLLTRDLHKQMLPGPPLQGIGFYRGYTLIGYRFNGDQTEVVSINTQTGAVEILAALAETAWRPSGFAVTPMPPHYPSVYPGNERAVLLSQSGTLTSVDLRSGAVSQIPLEQGADVFGLDVYTDTTLIGVRSLQGRSELAAIDLASGSVTALADLGEEPVTDMAVDAGRRRVYVEQDHAGTPAIHTYDLIQHRFW